MEAGIQAFKDHVIALLQFYLLLMHQRLITCHKSVNIVYEIEYV